MSRLGVLGCRTRRIGESASSPSPTSHLKNCCSALCLFNAVDADLVPIIHDRPGAILVVAIPQPESGKRRASSYSRSGTVSVAS